VLSPFVQAPQRVPRPCWVVLPNTQVKHAHSFTQINTRALPIFQEIDTTLRNLFNLSRFVL